MSNSASTAVARQWQIIDFLSQSDSYTSTSLILEHLNVKGIETDLRTVQRDLRSLQAHFPLECNESDRPYSWRWKKVANANAHTLTLEQAMCLRLIEQELSEHIPSEIFDELNPLLKRARAVFMSANKFDGFNQKPPIPTSETTLWQLLFGKKPNQSSHKAINKLVKELDKLNLNHLSEVVSQIRSD